MAEKFNYFKEVSFDNPSSIEFIGYVPCFTFTAFRIIGSDGRDTGYIGELAPDDLRHRMVFPVVTTAYAEAIANGEDVTGVPIGICANIRIVSSLLCLAYPKGISAETADFSEIEKCATEKKRIDLLSEDDALQVVSYAPFIEDWMKRKIAETGLADKEPNQALFP